MNQDEKDEKLCEEIVKILNKDGPQRVLLTGKGGIGKTRLAKMVGEYATKRELCYLTICLHLNKKFEGEESLYEYIASQLSVYSDFEETEVDDRDEDEEDEKTDKLLDELKNKIIKEITTRKEAAYKAREDDAAEKASEVAAKKVSKEAAEKRKKSSEKNEKKLQLGDGEDKPAAGLLKPAVSENTPDVGEKKDTLSTENPYILLILDDEGNKTSEDRVMKDLQLWKFLKEEILKDSCCLKILVTRRNKDEEPTKAGGETESRDQTSEDGDKKQEEAKSEEASEIEDDSKSQQGEADSDNNSVSDNKGTTEATGNPEITEGEIVPPTGAESKLASKSYGDIEFPTTDKSEALLNTINKANLTDLFVSLIPGDWKTEIELISRIVDKSKNLPAAIVVLANSLKLITNPGKKELIEKIDEVLTADRSDSSDSGSSSKSAVNPILYLGYVLLKFNDASKGAILDCFWHSLDFFEQCGCVYYRDLITQWMLEGYFDPVRSVEKAYQDGHSILMDLINRGMLKIQENNVVVPEMAMINLIDPRPRGHFGRSRLGFSRVYGGDKKMGIGKITQIDDMIKTVQAKKTDKITTILVSGDRLRRETPEKYFMKLKELEVLGLFEPTLEPFVPSFKDHLKLLRVLVIRDCDLLESIEDLKTLRKLNALEVSGASSLENISPGFFEAFLELRSLHLSGLKIKSSPPSISELKKLHCLIIRDCPLLKDLPNIQELEELEVIDISGARELKTCFDNTAGANKNKSKNKNFYLLKKLKLLDFSESQIERLPIFQDSALAEKLHSLTRLLLRNCSKLRRLPSLKPLSGLQILDLSGTTSLVEMLEVCFEDKHELKTLNLSGTNLSELATTIDELSSLNELLLRDCINLDAIPNIQKLENLEVIDVSGSTKLEKIEGSFENMLYLREVNLSGTKVKTPELPKDTKIHCLKRIFLADGRRFEGEEWSKIKEDIERDRSENASSADAVVTSQEISEEIREIQSDEPRASDRTEIGDASKERLLQVPIEKALYKKTRSSLVESPEEVMEINETNKLDEDALANAEFVSFVDCTPTRLTSIFKKTKSVKHCWLRMCTDIKDLFSGVDEEHLKSLETLSITNLASLETISSAGKLENLKNLTLDCCPKIKTIFPEMPASLPVLNVKHCEKLEKVVKGVDFSTLRLKCEPEPDHCPNFEGNPKDSDYVMVEHSDASTP